MASGRASGWGAIACALLFAVGASRAAGQEARSEDALVVPPPPPAGQDGSAPSGGPAPNADEDASRSPAAPAPSGDAAPGTSAPGRSAPGASAPGTSAPGTSAPGASAPGASAPGTSAPGRSAPGTSAPGTSAPGPSAPGGSEPVIPPPPAASTAPPSAPAGASAAAEPLLEAAEADLSAGRVSLALARAAAVIAALPEGAPLRIRAESLHLIAQRRPVGDAPAPAADEVFAPLVAQAELDLRARRAPLALPRLDLALAHLPAGSPLRRRAVQLRAAAAPAVGASTLPPAPPAAAGSPLASRPAERPVDPTRRGTGEIVELYITSAAFGALTGLFVPTVATADPVSGTTYTLTLIGGAGLMAVGVLTLDLAADLKTGLPPTLSSSIRFGFANGMLAWGLAEATDDPNAPESFTLIWGGAAVGLVTGLGVGFGLEPSVRDARFVESAGLWGGVLGTAVALMTEYRDPAAGLALSLVAMDAGLIAGVVTAASGAHPSTRRTLFLDLGFLAGAGAGALFPSLYYLSQRIPLEPLALGVGMAVGAVGGWTLSYLLTDGMDEAEDGGAPDVQAAVAPVEGGALLSVSGTL